MAEKRGPFLVDQSHIGIQTIEQDYNGNQEEVCMASTPKTKCDKKQFSLLQEYQSSIPCDKPYFQQPSNSFCNGQRSQTRLNGSQSIGQFGDPSQIWNNSTAYSQERLKSTDIPVKPPKEKKSISTKTFAHGLMDVSLLTTHAAQLRTVISNKEHEFYHLLIWAIGISIALQVLSGVLLLTSDFFKTQDKVKDRQNQKKRKVLSFISLCIVALNTPLKIMISAFYISHDQQSQIKTVPVFSPSSYFSNNHTEL